MAVHTAVITAAGFATRLLPASKAVPKVMLPLVDRPLIHYAVEQAVEAGIDRIILVTSRGSSAIADYFDLAPELERSLETRNNPWADEIRRISRMADIITMRQREPLGLGNAVLTARKAVGGQPFAVYLPDEVLMGTPSVTRQLLDAFEQRGTTLGVIDVPREEVARYGIVAGDQVSEREWRLRSVVEKPSVEEAPSTLAITGPYVFTPAIFDCLESIAPGAIGELQLTDGIAMLAEREPVHAYRYHGKRYDCGTTMGLLKASVELALQRPDMADELRKWLRGLGA
jgi:UTP--glucose-1-phosphate uridylyltransferase